ncbi:MAG: aminotransferase class IV family protein [Prolixibacteraceae bacterium]|nr:aminotransferase class IV family protein [Prolixibacteraceae bacterium]
MALLPIHDFFVLNDSVLHNRFFKPSENEGGIYEVLRVVDGVPLFLEDHLNRFYQSARIAGKIIRFNEIQIENLLKQLILKNKTNEGNVLISCKINLKAFFIPSNYPTPEMVEKGVVCGILKAERDNPNAKVFQTSVRQQANELIAEKGFYEVLLVDQLGKITEGSRSNVFFVKNDLIVTPPGNKVLLGITRQKILELIRNLGLNYTESDVFLSRSGSYNAAFLTGTSPKVLPVHKVEDIVFNPQNHVVRSLMESYNLLITKYISERNPNLIK